MKMMRPVPLLFLVLSLATPAAAQTAAGIQAPLVEGEHAAPQDDPIYERATEALDGERYEEAIELYGAVVEQGAARVDAALYWIAYAQSKAGRATVALETIARLRTMHPQSRWLNDAGYLEAEVRGAAGQAPSAETGADEEMRLYALNSLMHADSARALPLLRGILQGDEAHEMKARALFVLMQSDDDAAFDIVAQVAREDSDPKLRLQALRNLGMHGGARAGELMSEIYASTDDGKLKRAILRGYATSGDSERLLQIAREETSEELRIAAIRQLAMTGAAEEVWTLYQGESSKQAKRAILQSMFVTGEAGRLLEVARTDPDDDLRRAAIQGLAMVGGDGNDDSEISAALVELYGTETDVEIRAGTLQALWMRGEASALIALFEQEPDREMRRRIVQALSMMESEEAIEFLIRIIEQ